MKLKQKALLKIVGLELLIIFFFTLNGAYVHITNPSRLALQYAGLIPLAVGIFIYLLLTRKWNEYFFIQRGRSLKGIMQLSWPLLIVLLIIVIDNKGAYIPSVADILLLFIVQLFVVTFIEELFFRGFMLKILRPKGFQKAVLISSALFAFTHSLQLLGGQSIEATLLQITYAFIIGIVLSLLIINHQSILLAIVFHGLNNFLQMSGNGESSLILSIFMTAILSVHAVFLWRRAATIRTTHICV